MNPVRGKFITFEGIEGVGKSTQVALIAAAMTRRGIGHVVTREPGGTPMAERIRAIVLDPDGESMPAAAELLLMFAARSVHLANRIEPALSSGQHVLCDRFTDATYAYQGAGRGADIPTIALLERCVHPRTQPDLTLLLELPVMTALTRARARGGADRFEQERQEFFERVRMGYLERAAAHPARFAIIDASDSESAVLERIGTIIETRFNIKL